MSCDLFISYSSRDSLVAAALCKALEGAGVSCWIAPRNITPGQTWSEAIIDGLNASKLMVLLYSSASNASPQVLREVERAVNKGLRLLAFRVEDVPPSKAMEYLISVSHWQDATVVPLEAALQSLIANVRALLSVGAEDAPETTPYAHSTPSPNLLSVPNNLPAALTSFVGRMKELADIERMLPLSRMLTLVGPGGSGKTRLAGQAARNALQDYPDGVWEVELEALSDSTLVPQEVAAALQIAEQSGKPLLNTLAETLHGRRTLLLLDNCEHLLDACSRLSSKLLSACPNLHLLATSQAPLNVAGEAVYRVPSLSLPDPRKMPPLEDLQRYEAVQLFVERAVLTQPSFALTESNALAVVQVCTHLDGIPLALELAAARVRAMPVERIADHLHDRFKLLTGGAKSALPRQQTLKALLDWSCGLLNEEEKTLLHRLSVFAGGWTQEEAEQVCTGEEIEDWEILDLLFSLVDKSLVVYEEQGESARYRLQETIRQYAAEQLPAHEDEEPIRRRHRDYFLALAEEAQPQLKGANQKLWLERLEAEHDNLQAALQYSLNAHEEQGLRFCKALWWFWYVRGYLSAGRAWCEAALAECGGEALSPFRAEALNGAGCLAYRLCDFEGARERLEASLAIRRATSDSDGAARALSNLGMLAYDVGDLPTARRCFEESLELGKELDDKEGMAATINNLGMVAYDEGNKATAAELYEASLVLRRELGNRWGIAATLLNVAASALEEKDLHKARSLYEESLALFRELEDKRGIADTLSNLGVVLLAEGDLEAAKPLFVEALKMLKELEDRLAMAMTLQQMGSLKCRQGALSSGVRLWSAAAALRETIGAVLPPGDQEALQAEIVAVRERLGEADWEAAWAAGHAMALGEVIAFALYG